MASDEEASRELVSWLELEQFHLDELSPERAAQVQEALDSCEETRLCLAQIEAEAGVDLPPLEVQVSPTERQIASPAGRVLRFALRPTVIYPLVAAAAALFLMFGLEIGVETPGSELGPGGRIKGGDVSFTLVRKRGQSEELAAGVFTDGDRFKVNVSCPPEARTELDLAVIQGGQVFFPLNRQPQFVCGNNVTMPGAFGLTGQLKTRVCLLWGSPLPARSALKGRALENPGGQSVCQTLRPAP